MELAALRLRDKKYICSGSLPRYYISISAARLQTSQLSWMVIIIVVVVVVIDSGGGGAGGAAREVTPER